jgi:hypothetical protein
VWRETKSGKQWDLDFGVLRGYVLKWREDQYDAYFNGGKERNLESLEDAQKVVEIGLRSEIKKIEQQMGEVKAYLNKL